MKKIALILLAAIGMLVVLVFINPQIKPSHTEPYLALAQERAASSQQWNKRSFDPPMTAERGLLNA